MIYFIYIYYYIFTALILIHSFEMIPWFSQIAPHIKNMNKIRHNTKHMPVCSTLVTVYHIISDTLGYTVETPYNKFWFNKIPDTVKKTYIQIYDIHEIPDITIFFLVSVKSIYLNLQCWLNKIPDITYKFYGLPGCYISTFPDCPGQVEVRFGQAFWKTKK